MNPNYPTGGRRWRGVIDAYRSWLPVSDSTPVVSLERRQHAAGAGGQFCAADWRRF